MTLLLLIGAAACAWSLLCLLSSERARQLAEWESKQTLALAPSQAPASPASGRVDVVEVPEV